MKASLFCLLPAVLSLSLGTQAFADEAPVPEAAPVAEPASADAEVDAAPVLIAQPVAKAGRPGPVAAPAAEAPTLTKLVGRVKSPAMIIVGSILSGIGAAGLVSGGVMFAQADADAAKCSNDASDSFGIGAAFCGMTTGLTKSLATGLMIAGGIHTAVGIPLIAVGSQAPKKKQNDEAPAPRADLQIGATGATFTMSF